MIYQCRSWGYNSNTAMKAALKRTAMRYPYLTIPEPKYNSPGWQYVLSIVRTFLREENRRGSYSGCPVS